MNEPDLQPWITLPDAAFALGIPRAHLDTLKTVTKPDFKTRMDDKSIRRNRKLYQLHSFKQWLIHHLGGLSATQVERLDAAGRVILPSVREGGAA